MPNRQPAPKPDYGAFISACITPGLVVAALLVTFFHVQLHRSSDLSYLTLNPDNNNSAWEQPASVNTLFPNAISDSAWQFDYNGIEKLLSGIRASDTKELVIGTQTADILNKAVNAIDININPKNLERLKFLVEKELPTDAGDELAKLLIAYFNYTHHDDTKPTASLGLQQQKILQEQYFGEKNAQQLFSKRNAIRDYLDKRQIIQRNQTLNESQKNTALNLLEKNFKKNNKSAQ